MLTAFLPAAAALLTTSATTKYTTTTSVDHYLWSHNIQNLYTDQLQQQEIAYYQQFFTTSHTMLPQLEINENIFINTTTSMPLTTTSTYIPPAVSHIVLLPLPKTTVMTATASTNTTTTTAQQQTPSLPTAFASSTILMSPALTSSMASPLAGLAGTSTASSMFFENDLLPAVFVNANNNNNDTRFNSNRNTTTLGLGGVVGDNSIEEDDDNLNSFYFYEVSQPYSNLQETTTIKYKKGF